jgi:hypothetical protein
LTFDSKKEDVYTKSGIREASHVNNSYTTEDGGTVYSGNTGEIRSMGKDDYTIMHETLHLLGFSDRYGRKSGKPYKGYAHDIMGAYHQFSLKISHYNQILDFVKTHQDRISKQGELPVKEEVDVTYNKEGVSKLKP